MVAVQGSLLDVLKADAGLGSLDASERLELEDGAWVEFRREWMAGSEALFERLVDEVDWQAERRHMYDRVVDVPRLVAFHGENDPLPDPLLVTARDALNTRYAGESGGPLCTAGFCLYRDGRDSVAWHGDTNGRGRTDDTVVAIVSLGARRRFLIRRRAAGPSMRFEIGGGDLLVMGGSCQRTYEHAVPKTARQIGPRISVQFRQHNVS